MSLQAISTPNAPIGANVPYSQAIVVGNLVFVSGCIPMDNETKTIKAEGIEAQARQALKNLKAVVEASGSSIDKIAKTTVFIKDMDDFAKMNVVYAEFFAAAGDRKPARSCVEVARLPMDVLFEIECVAVL